jgi:transposase InsO family protein
LLCAEGIKEYPADLVCQTIGVTKSSFYNRKRVSQTEREKRRGEEGEAVRKTFEESRREYGRVRLKKALANKGIHMSEGKIGQLMKEEGLVPKKCRKYKATTNSRHKYQVADNLLKREFQAPAPNKKWCGDSTYIWTEEGWLYAAGNIDLCDRVCVGLAFSERHTQDLMIKALENAAKRWRPAAGLLFHSDRGVQYASNEYKKKLKQFGMIQSMSRSGEPYDNAAMESFWSTVKLGCVEGVRFTTRKQAMKAIFEYVFGFYNTHRLHSANGLTAPLEYRKKLQNTA